ncbi:bleomycin resistance protein [Mucilaginibacter lacusdianchii]|uniref:bleomycin resistance protein n=1 Tax=Mucilaginibacter lacusdianchii TaxID=2684211 RepID=UPI00131D3BF9|nr:VOC family protein [Mucilaginibacter sp. JXJ CY 39]
MLQTAIPILASLNEAESITFYTEKLKFTLQANWTGYLILSRDDIYLHLWPCNDVYIAQSTGCYINVNDIENLYAEYEPLGIVHPNAKLEDKPWGRRQFSVLDNNGNIIHFGQAL